MPEFTCKNCNTKISYDDEIIEIRKLSNHEGNRRVPCPRCEHMIEFISG